jgi:hypothetical protein
MLSYTDVWDIVNRWQIQMRVTWLRNLALLGTGTQSGTDMAVVVIPAYKTGHKRQNGPTLTSRIQITKSVDHGQTSAAPCG